MAVHAQGTARVAVPGRAAARFGPRTVELGVLGGAQALARLRIGEELAGAHLPRAGLAGVLLPVADDPAAFPVATEVLLEVDGAECRAAEHGEHVELLGDVSRRAHAFLIFWLFLA